MSAWALTFLAIISVVVTVTSLAQVALMIGALIGLRRLQSLCTAAPARWQPMLDRAGRWALQGSRAVQAADQWLWESDAVGQGAGAVDVLSANGRGVPMSGVANRESAQPAAAVRPPLQPGQLGWQDIPGLLKAAGSAWVDDYAGSMGAALAYYTLFSLAPLLIIVIAVAGAVFGGEAVRGEVVAQLQGLIGRDGAQAVQGLLASASRPSTGVVAAAIGTVTLLLGATSVFAELQSALDRIWRAPVPAEFGVWGTVRARLLSFGLVVTIGFLLLVSLVGAWRTQGGAVTA